jgi:hypothetical protein
MSLITSDEDTRGLDYLSGMRDGRTYERRPDAIALPDHPSVDWTLGFDAGRQAQRAETY